MSSSSVTEKAITSRETLLAHAMAIESEAVERYEALADQMEVHNNPEVAVFFRKMAEIEGLHVAHVEQVQGDTPLPHIAPWDLAWGDDESPEGPQHHEEVHYLMTPHQAIRLAMDSEQRAADFFASVRDDTRAAADVRQLAGELAADEIEHIRLLGEWLERHPEPAPDWDEDLDPPMLQE